MKVIITGGAGFIGSHVVDRLIIEGHRAVILDDFSTGNRDFVNPKAIVVEADICDAAAVNRAFVEHKPDAVFHLAAMIDLRASMENPQHSHQVNVEGSMNIINASKSVGVKKIVFSSSAAVYGDNQNLPIKETEPINPSSPYGEQKAQTEADLKESGIASIILRYANVYGPRQGTVGEGGVVAIFCKKLAHTEPLVIFGDGEQTRDFVYVDDVAAANLAALSSTQPFGIYNISTGTETSVNELASLLLSLSQKDTTMEHTDAVPGEVLRSSLDAVAASQTLGWEPAINIKKGLEETWQWFKNASF